MVSDDADIEFSPHLQRAYVWLRGPVRRFEKVRMARWRLSRQIAMGLEGVS